MYRTFGGFANDENTQQERDLLWASLSNEDKLSVDMAAPFYFAAYDPPFKAFSRRNEIWLIRHPAQFLKQKKQ